MLHIGSLPSDCLFPLKKFIPSLYTHILDYTIQAYTENMFGEIHLKSGSHICIEYSRHLKNNDAIKYRKWSWHCIWVYVCATLQLQQENTTPNWPERKYITYFSGWPAYGITEIDVDWTFDFESMTIVTATLAIQYAEDSIEQCSFYW